MSQTKKDLKSYRTLASIPDGHRKMKPFSLLGGRQQITPSYWQDWSMEQGLRDGYNAKYVKRHRRELQEARKKEDRASRHRLKNQLKKELKEIL